MKSFMADRLDFQLLSKGLRRAGWIRFWSQVTLGVVVVGILATNRFAATSGKSIAPGWGAAVGVTTLAFLILIYSLWHGWQVVKFGRALDSPARPSRGEAGQLMKRGVFVDLLGLTLSVVGYQAYGGSLFMETLKQTPGVAIGTITENFTINSIQILSLLSNTQVLFAHLIGLIISIWLLRRVYQTR